VDDPVNEAAQTIAGALLGAGIAAGGLVYYRRRHPLIVG
jgi:LPXTG-motif cell wall-anchored protein